MKVRFKDINTINTECDFPLSATNKNKYKNLLNSKNSGRHYRHSEIPKDVINNNNDFIDTNNKTESIRKKYLARSKEKNLNQNNIQEKRSENTKLIIGTPSELIIKAREFSKIRNTKDNSTDKIENDDNFLSKFNSLNYHENKNNINQRNIRNNEKKFPNTKTDTNLVDSSDNSKDFSSKTFINLKKNQINKENKKVNKNNDNENNNLTNENLPKIQKYEKLNDLNRKLTTPSTRQTISFYGANRYNSKSKQLSMSFKEYDQNGSKKTLDKVIIKKSPIRNPNINKIENNEEESIKKNESNINIIFKNNNKRKIKCVIDQDQNTFDEPRTKKTGKIEKIENNSYYQNKNYSSVNLNTMKNSKIKKNFINNFILEKKYPEKECEFQISTPSKNFAFNNTLSNFRPKSRFILQNNINNEKLAESDIDNSKYYIKNRNKRMHSIDNHLKYEDSCYNTEDDAFCIYNSNNRNTVGFKSPNKEINNNDFYYSNYYNKTKIEEIDININNNNQSDKKNNNNTNNNIFDCNRNSYRTISQTNQYNTYINNYMNNNNYNVVNNSNYKNMQKNIIKLNPNVLTNNLSIKNLNSANRINYDSDYNTQIKNLKNVTPLYTKPNYKQNTITGNEENFSDNNLVSAFESSSFSGLKNNSNNINNLNNKLGNSNYNLYKKNINNKYSDSSPNRIYKKPIGSKITVENPNIKENTIKISEKDKEFESENNDYNNKLNKIYSTSNITSLGSSMKSIFITKENTNKIIFNCKKNIIKEKVINIKDTFIDKFYNFYMKRPKFNLFNFNDYITKKYIKIYQIPLKNLNYISKINKENSNKKIISVSKKLKINIGVKDNNNINNFKQVYNNKGIITKKNISNAKPFQRKKIVLDKTNSIPTSINASSVDSSDKKNDKNIKINRTNKTKKTMNKIKFADIKNELNELKIVKNIKKYNSDKNLEIKNIKLLNISKKIRKIKSCVKISQNKNDENINDVIIDIKKEINKIIYARPNNYLNNEIKKFINKYSTKNKDEKFKEDLSKNLNEEWVKISSKLNYNSRSSFFYINNLIFELFKNELLNYESYIKIIFKLYDKYFSEINRVIKKLYFDTLIDFISNIYDIKYSTNYLNHLRKINKIIENDIKNEKISFTTDKETKQKISNLLNKHQQYWSTYISKNNDDDNNRKYNNKAQLKEDITKFINFLKENNINNTIDYKNKKNVNGKYKMIIVESLVKNNELNINEILTNIIQICKESIINATQIYIYNLYLMNVIDFFDNKSSLKTDQEFNNYLKDILLNINKICSINYFMFEVLGYLFFILLEKDIFDIMNFNIFISHDELEKIDVCKVIKTIIISDGTFHKQYYDAFKELDLFKGSKLFLKNITKELRDKGYLK